MADPFGGLPPLPSPGGAATPAPGISISAPKEFAPPVDSSDAEPPEAKDHFVGVSSLEPPKDQGVAANVGAGTNEAVTQFLGMPVDLATAAVNALPDVRSGLNEALPPQMRKYATEAPAPITNPVGGSAWLRSMEHTYGGAPEDVQAVTPTEQVARTAARGATSMALPGGAAKALPELAGTAEALRGTIAAGAKPSGMIAGTTGALTGAGAAAVVPEPYKGVAETVGNLAGGAFGAATLGTIADAALDRGLQALARESAPAATAAQAAQTYTGEQVSPKDVVRAGQRIAQASRQPQALTLTGQESPVEGFQPTLGQSSGDLGVLALERELRNRYRDLFIAHDAANTAALSQAIEGLAPEEASAAAGRFVRSHLDALNAADQAEQAQLTGTAQQATEGLGGQPAATTATDLGSAARERLEQIRVPLKNAASRALESVDPDGTLALPTDNVADAAHGLLGSEGAETSPFTINARAGERPAGPETPVLQAAANMGGVNSFSDLRALLGQVAAAQRAIRIDPALGAESRPYARMAQLRGAIEDAMVNGAERSTEVNAARSAAAEAPTVVEPFSQNLTAARDEWYASRNAGTDTSQASGNGQGAGRDAGIGPSAVPGASGTAGEAGGRPGGAPRVSAIPEEAQPLTPNFDEEAASRLAVANRAYADYKQRFRQGPVGRALASGNTPSGYRMGDAQVVGQLFRPGAQGADAIDSLIQAAGSPEAAARVLGDYPAYSLRQAAETNGILDPARYARWAARYSDALSRLPDLQARFGDAARASQELADSATRWQAVRTDIEDSALRHYLRVDPDVAPQQAIDRLMRTPNPGAEARQLMFRLWNDPDALAGAQRNAVDWVLGRIRGTAEAGTTGERELSKAALQRILEGNPAQADALRTILGPERFAMLGRVSDAMDMAARAYQAVGIKGSPGTAADVHALGLHAPPSLLVQTWLGEKAGDILSHAVGLVGGFTGAALRGAGAIGGILMNRARSQGFERAEQLATQGVLHPELGRLLVGAAAQSERDPRLITIARQLAMLGILGAEHQNQERQRHARGGAVSAADIHREAKRADPEPSEAQKDAGNYRKGHITLHGLPITIENAKGSWRRGIDKSGKSWASRLPAIYGYIKRTEGMDGEHVDVYVGPDHRSDKVFIIDQIDADTGKPDEHKAMLGFKDFGQALDVYHRAFSDGRGPDRFGAVKAMDIAEFKDWLENDGAKAPVAA